MVEGTKPFKGKSSAQISSTKEVPHSPPQEDPAPDAVNLGRREWFSALIPAFGDGLVKLLRTSNNLQRDIHEAVQQKADLLIQSDREQSEK